MRGPLTVGAPKKSLRLSPKARHQEGEGGDQEASHGQLGVRDLGGAISPSLSLYIYIYIYIYIYT